MGSNYDDDDDDTISHNDDSDSKRLHKVVAIINDDISISSIMTSVFALSALSKDKFWWPEANGKVAHCTMMAATDGYTARFGWTLLKKKFNHDYLLVLLIADIHMQAQTVAK
eukprot:scaffold237707_cov48-Prasinocladus_malaysianus.AAC.2